MAFFQRKPLLGFEIGSLLAYTLLTGVVVGAAAYGPQEALLRPLLLTYTFEVQLLLYVLFYQSLRNPVFFALCCLFGGLHLLLYYLLRHSGVHIAGAPPTGCQSLRATLPLLLLFQCLRLVSLAAQALDLVCPAKHGQFDIYHERRVTLLDIVLLLVYLLAVVLLSLV
ncbi:hypothetical protein [Hymenobacter sp. CRA2]|uniref:hypothetical protein n=1 Tax=Hymenobacter sp. CRA2 TaxID=1955620 RepID=UPI00098F9E31|nr:hypothetical protein [Hymenobacter sp. CRA2]OON67974.1 hypothetical protein B0919_15000 [Hymenobacter sp. CRA2]